jgi:hypothetical protein
VLSGVGLRADPMCLGRAVLHLCGMSNCRCVWAQYDTYFFTVKLLERRCRLLMQAIEVRVLF